MSIQKGINKFASKWVKNMQEKVPVRTGTLKKSIESIDRPKPVIDMMYYGQYVDSGTKYMKAQPFIDPAFDETFKDMEEVLPEEVFKQIEIAFDKTFQ